MKNLLYFSIACLSLSINACQSKQSPLANKEAIRTEITSFLNELYSVYETKDFEAYAEKLSDEGLFLGTDRKEIWNKSEMLAMMRTMYQNSNYNFTYKITTRIIRISDDQNSALVIEHLEDTPVFGKNLPVRVTTQLLKNNNKWFINYMAWGVIPDNKDLFKIKDILSNNKQATNGE